MTPNKEQYENFLKLKTDKIFIFPKKQGEEKRKVKRGKRLRKNSSASKLSKSKIYKSSFHSLSSQLSLNKVSEKSKNSNDQKNAYPFGRKKELKKIGSTIIESIVE